MLPAQLWYYPNEVLDLMLLVSSSWVSYPVLLSSCTTSYPDPQIPHFGPFEGVIFTHFEHFGTLSWTSYPQWFPIKLIHGDPTSRKWSYLGPQISPILVISGTYPRFHPFWTHWDGPGILPGSIERHSLGILDPCHPEGVQDLSRRGLEMT